MKKTMTTVAVLIATMTTTANAERLSLDAVKLTSDKPVVLNQRERDSVKVSRQQRALPAKPMHTGNGSVNFVFGDSAASIVCAIERICDIALQPGEKVKDVLIGDSARWQVQPAISGSGNSETVHAVIKPFDVGLKTNLMITTDRRVYHVNLKSARIDHMPYVTFTYPEDQQRAWTHLIAKAAAQERQQKAQLVDGLGLSVDDLNFRYKVQGTASWRPNRVFDDGIKTYIELLPGVAAKDAPVLFIKSDNQKAITNYRLKGNRFVIDGLIDHAELVRGVGRKAETITIKRAS